jgi:hypothetical protein
MKPKHILIAFRNAGWYLRFPGQQSLRRPGLVPDRCVELYRYDYANREWVHRWITGIPEEAIEEYKRFVE